MAAPSVRSLGLMLLVCLALVVPASGQATGADEEFEPIRYGAPDDLDHMAPFFPGANYDASIPTPDEMLGVRHGSRLSHHAEILACFERWAAVSPRVDLKQFGTTFEGRPLVRAVITSPANLERLGEIKADLGRLAHADGLSEAGGQELVARTPPVAWMAYSIHGDELSGSDAAVALGYHLVASTDDDVAQLLQDVVVVIDPCQNPDGRERIIAMTEQGTGYVPNLDYDSMARGRWPWGRGNHYLFDMNRDWITGVLPETRARWAEARSFHPQLLIDAHEMGPLDTYLFYPQNQPHNPWLPPALDAWQDAFAADQAAAFDRQGWPYYTREWADGWAPFYTDAWGSLNGAVGILYEQASTSGMPLRAPSGRINTYREAVHRQATSSLANLTTLQGNRSAIMADYLAHKRANVAADTPGNDRMFVVVPGRNATRERKLLEMLAGQGIVAVRTDSDAEVSGVVTALGERLDTFGLPAGSWVVQTRQPQSPLVQNYLGFDVRMHEAFLEEEREELEREGGSKIYDATAWSVPLMWDLDALWCDAADLGGEAITAAEAPVGGIPIATSDRAPFGWVVDGSDDASVAFAAHAMELGVALHLSDKPFTTGGREYPRGSLLVRRDDNEQGVERVDRAAREAGVTAWPTTSGRSPDEGPDLGGGHFTLLSRPRVAMLSNAPVAPDTYGHLWFHLDHEVGVPVTQLDAQNLGGYDLRRYNVIVIPPTWGGLGGLLSQHGESLKTWVRGGGTLIAVGGAASTVAGSSVGLSSVKRRRDTLDDLDGYLFAAKRERASRDVSIDMEDLWGPKPGDVVHDDDPDGNGAHEDETPADGDDGGDDADDDGDEDADDEKKNGDKGSADPDKKRQDAWMRRFAPRGAIVRGLVDDKAWVTVGSGDELPVTVNGSTAYLSRSPVQTAVRLAPAESLRLSGLLWPEARQRLADSAWLTVERSGAGQVILFADVPGFRGQFVSGARLFANAVVYGPGAGARQPLGW